MRHGSPIHLPIAFPARDLSEVVSHSIQIRISGQDYLILILVCAMILTTTGALHAFLLYTNDNKLQVGFVKAGIYVGQLAVSVQVIVVIQRMDIEWQVLGPD